MTKKKREQFSLKIKSDTKKMLNECKLVESESFDSVIRRLIEDIKSKDDIELTTTKLNGKFSIGFHTKRDGFLGQIVLTKHN